MYASIPHSNRFLSGGAFCEHDFVYVNWEKDYPSMKNMHINYKKAAMAALSIIKWHRRVQRGGSGGPDPPLFLDPPFSSVTPPPTQPDLTDKCNVNCFLIVYYAV